MMDVNFSIINLRKSLKIRNRYLKIYNEKEFYRTNQWEGELCVTLYLRRIVFALKSL